MTTVNVVTVDYQTEIILSRLVRPLVDELGWSHSKKPVPGVDVTYYFPYLTLGLGPDPGRTMAFFTHRDVGRPEKVEAWDHADARVDMRTVCSRLYWRQLGSPKIIVTPDIQLEKFVPGDGHRHAVVGTDGFTYPAGRKGEALFGRLMRHPVMHNVDFEAAGRGWPCECRLWPWDRLHEFFQRLSVYVSTSTIEGTGHGPMQALACGVPTVIPMGVGVFDELEGMGIHRYEAGNLDQLVLAVEDAMMDSTPPEDIRECVTKYTHAAWLRTNEAAVVQLMAGTP